MFSKGILSWSLMPGMLCVLSMREGLVVRKSSRMFLPLVGSRIDNNRASTHTVEPDSQRSRSRSDWSCFA